jgi:acetoin utilization deacetylase AcuC-like enzyme
MMNIYYHEQYNIDLRLFKRLHPFDGMKFSKIIETIRKKPGIRVRQPVKPVSQAVIDAFAGELLRPLLGDKQYILSALELPFPPDIPFSTIDRKILSPLRWAVQGTIDAMRDALGGSTGWNLFGGFHHASADFAEGFCVYNDIGIAYNEHLKARRIEENDRILIIDVDAHHGNGNAQTFMESGNVAIVDIFNDDIYPQSPHTKKRVDIAVPLHTAASGREYLGWLENALNRIHGDYRMAFVIAGTDVLAADPLGGFRLTIEDVVQRDMMIFQKLRRLSIPVVYLGGGGYSKDSVKAISRSLSNLHMELS